MWDLVAVAVCVAINAGLAVWLVLQINQWKRLNAIWFELCISAWRLRVPPWLVEQMESDVREIAALKRG